MHIDQEFGWEDEPLILYTEDGGSILEAEYDRQALLLGARTVAERILSDPVLADRLQDEVPPHRLRVYVEPWPESRGTSVARNVPYWLMHVWVNVDPWDESLDTVEAGAAAMFAAHKVVRRRLGLPPPEPLVSLPEVVPSVRIELRFPAQWSDVGVKEEWRDTAESLFRDDLSSRPEPAALWCLGGYPLLDDDGYIFAFRTTANDLDQICTYLESLAIRTAAHAEAVVINYPLPDTSPPSPTPPAP